MGIFKWETIFSLSFYIIKDIKIYCLLLESRNDFVYDKRKDLYMKETILLYNLDSTAIRNKIKFLCIQGGIHIRVVEKNQYDVPIGTLAFGKKEDMEPYLRSENSEEKSSFDDPMLVFAGFTGQKLDQFLNAMRKQKIPKIDLKAMLTEHNVKWDSVTLHDELAKEHQAMNKK